MTLELNAFRRARRTKCDCEVYLLNTPALQADFGACTGEDGKNEAEPVLMVKRMVIAARVVFESDARAWYACFAAVLGRIVRSGQSDDIAEQLL